MGDEAKSLFQIEVGLLMPTLAIRHYERERVRLKREGNDIIEKWSNNMIFALNAYCPALHCPFALYCHSVCRAFLPSLSSLVCLVMPPPVDSINLVSLESEGEEKRGRKGGRLTARGPKRVIHRANPNPQGGRAGRLKSDIPCMDRQTTDR